MAFSVVMPALEMAQETGKLLAWRKKEGDRVAKGEPLLDVETDKAVVEVEAPADGFLAGIKASEGSDIPVGQTIAWIVQAGENPPADSAVTAASARAGVHANQHTTAPAAQGPSASLITSGTAKISPKARRLAKELGIDLASVRGTGPDGEVLAADVQSAAHTTQCRDGRLIRPERSESGLGPTQQLEPPTTLGRIMAERTTQSWTTVPHFFVTREIDATALQKYRDRIVGEIEDKDGVRVTHTDLLVAILARVLLKHPRLNANWTAEGIRLHEHVNIGIAIAVKDGVVAAVVPNAHRAALAEIGRQRGAIAERARAGKLRPADIADATFTISNLGMYQVDQFSAIITPPQAAVLAVGAVTDRVIALEGKPVVRPMMTLTLSCDHRVVDGARAAQFLSDMAQALADPEKVLA